MLTRPHEVKQKSKLDVRLASAAALACTQAYFSILTSLTDRLINIEFSSSAGRKAIFYEAGEVSLVLWPRQRPFRFENLRAAMEGNHLIVSDGKWDVTVTSRVQRGINATSCRSGRCVCIVREDVSSKAQTSCRWVGCML